MQYDENLTAARQNFVTHLECSETGERYEAGQIHGLSRAGQGCAVPTPARPVALCGARKQRLAMAVDDADIVAARDRIAAWEQAVDRGLVGKTDRCVLFNCATGLKYPMPEADAWLDRHQLVDWEALAAA